MKTEIVLDQNDFAHLNKIDHSIEHWSLEYTKLCIQSDGLKEQVRDLYLSRQSFLHGKAKSKDVDLKSIKKINLEKREDGSMVLVVISGDVPEDGSE